MKLIEPLKASLELVEALTSSLIESALLSSLLIVQNPLVMINNLLVQALKNIVVTPLSFDLIIESVFVYHVLIFITFIINNNHKINDTFNHNLNINDMFRLS
jgi:hypothetical protein